jgi:hypothetical protein
MRRLDVAAAAILVAVAAISAGRAWTGPIAWTPDGYFYEAQVREVRGAESGAALRAVFDGRLTAARRARERATLAPRDRRVSNAAWVRYSARFYRRRWSVPLLAAAVYPVFGTRSLELVSLLGYLVAAVALYAVARLRFGPLPSAIAATVATLLPQYRAAALSPLTDSWGIALEALCIVLAVWFCRSGRRLHAALFALAVFALAFTRDNAAVVALALLAVGIRSRRALVLGAVAAVAAVIPSLTFGTHYAVLLAYTLAQSHIPPSTSLSWSLHHYDDGLRALARGLDSPRRLGIPPVTGIGLLVGIAGLLGLRRGGTAWWLLVASLAAGVAFMLSLPQESYRIALVLLPAATAGFAALAALLLERRKSPVNGVPVHSPTGTDPRRS